MIGDELSYTRTGPASVLPQLHGTFAREHMQASFAHARQLWPSLL